MKDDVKQVREQNDREDVVNGQNETDSREPFVPPALERHDDLPAVTGFTVPANI